jgi:hypothetical protein
MLWQAIRDAWNRLTVPLSHGEAGRKRRIQHVKHKIRHHCEASQARMAGGALFDPEGLIRSGAVQPDELIYVQDALEELVADGILERVPGQSYALHGRGPFGRLNPP